VSTLFLIPTEMERKLFLAAWRQRQGTAFSGRLEICGFGPIASAAVSMMLLQRIRPNQVYLLGIAGSYDLKLAEVGSAHCFGAVVTDAVGAESRDGIQYPSEMGLAQVAEHHVAFEDPIHSNRLGFPVSSTASHGLVKSIFQRIDLSVPEDPGKLLLTVGHASGSVASAENRRQRFPGIAADQEIVAEDMEGFSVAMACRLMGIGLTIIRGISNQAGDRLIKHWEIDLALDQVAALCDQRCESVADV